MTTRLTTQNIIVRINWNASSGLLLFLSIHIDQIIHADIALLQKALIDHFMGNYPQIRKNDADIES